MHADGGSVRPMKAWNDAIFALQRGDYAGGLAKAEAVLAAAGSGPETARLRSGAHRTRGDACKLLGQVRRVIALPSLH